MSIDFVSANSDKLKLRNVGFCKRWNEHYYIMVIIETNNFNVTYYLMSINVILDNLYLLMNLLFSRCDKSLKIINTL